ncbi:hypothetical protein [Hydrogenobacter thermophilus]|jgi:hypothetical protein|uniref:type IV toxin-antitoxin system AbiEi family antitoxin domain-containing protein n=1 Tax=Hydrogenobacter thermophilus TaxID=940 RepID=UPI0030FB6CDE
MTDVEFYNFLLQNAINNRAVVSKKLKRESGLPHTTFHYKLNRLVSFGLLSRIAKGVYQFNNSTSVQSSNIVQSIVQSQFNDSSNVQCLCNQCNQLIQLLLQILEKLNSTHELLLSLVQSQFNLSSMIVQIVQNGFNSSNLVQSQFNDSSSSVQGQSNDSSNLVQTQFNNSSNLVQGIGDGQFNGEGIVQTKFKDSSNSSNLVQSQFNSAGNYYSNYLIYIEGKNKEEEKKKEKEKHIEKEKNNSSSKEEEQNTISEGGRAQALAQVEGVSTPKKKRKSKKLEDSTQEEKLPTKDAVIYFANVYQAKLGGIPYQITWGKDMKIMKEVLKTQGVERTFDLIDAYFKYSEPPYTIGRFKVAIPELQHKIQQEKDENYRKAKEFLDYFKYKYEQACGVAYIETDKDIKHATQVVKALNGNFDKVYELVDYFFEYEDNFLRKTKARTPAMFLRYVGILTAKLKERQSFEEFKQMWLALDEEKRKEEKKKKKMDIADMVRQWQGGRL